MFARELNDVTLTEIVLGEAVAVQTFVLVKLQQRAQFTAEAFTRVLKDHDVAISTVGKGR